jgi:hypothetical protein
MSRGHGRVQRAIEAVIRDNPSSTFSTAELAARVYPDIRVEKKKAHHVALLRAARDVVYPNWWTMAWAGAPGHQMILYNLCDVMSYATGRLREGFLYGSCSPDVIHQMLTNPTHPWSCVNWIIPGGTWWTHVEINQARRDGRHEQAEEMRSVLHADVARQLAALPPLR